MTPSAYEPLVLLRLLIHLQMECDKTWKMTLIRRQLIRRLCMTMKFPVKEYYTFLNAA